MYKGEKWSINPKAPASIVNIEARKGGGGGTKYPISLEVNRQVSLINWQISP